MPLTSFDKRKGDEHSAAALLACMHGPLSGIQGALAIPFNPPAVQGLENFGGFTFEVEELGRNSVQQIANTAYALIGEGNTSGTLTGLFTSFTANDPQYLVQIGRQKAKSLQVPFTQITDALQVYRGSVYVNDFDFNNRSYRVYVQSEGRYRSSPKDIGQYYLRSDTGKLIPLDNFTKIEQTTNPQVISHYNLFRSAEISGSGAPGRSSDQATADMEALAKKTLPNGMTYEWSGLSLKEIESGGKALILFGLGLVSCT
jgi:HAE1 family hydrophobic/amphiphilic exporter-1